jgi:hypothetical protein
MGSPPSKTGTALIQAAVLVFVFVGDSQRVIESRRNPNPFSKEKTVGEGEAFPKKGKNIPIKKPREKDTLAGETLDDFPSNP